MSPHIVIDEIRMMSHCLHRVLDDLTDEQIAVVVPAIAEDSIAQIAVHSMGGIVAATRLLADQTGPRPIRAIPTTLAELRATLDTLCLAAIQAAQQLPESAWTGTHAVPFPRPDNGGRTATGYEVMLLMLSHAQRHIGTIQAVRSVNHFPTYALG